MASSDGSSGDRVHSRRRVLGWAAAAAGLARGVPVASASAAPAASSAPAVSTGPIIPGGATRSVPEPAAARVGQVLGAKTRTNTVALTIDDGPDPTWTPKVLDLLAANGVHATFSLIGRQAQAYPTLVRRIVHANPKISRGRANRSDGSAEWVCGAGDGVRRVRLRAPR